MIDDLYRGKMADLNQWASWNASDGNRATARERDIFIFRKLRGFAAALVESVGYQQQLEGRMPGDPDDRSTFPFPDALADRRRLGTGPSLIVPLRASLPGRRIIV